MAQRPPAPSERQSEALDAFNSIIAKVRVPRENIRGAQLIVKVLRGSAYTGSMAQALVDIEDETSAWEDAELGELRDTVERVRALVRAALPPGTLEGHGEEASDASA